MSRTALRFTGLLIAIMATEATAQSARRAVVAPPAVSSIFPPGATVGKSAEWTLKGRGFAKVKQVLVSGTGVKIVDFSIKSDTEAVATVQVDPKAESGVREIRVEGPDGVSNLLLARIDTLSQSVEVEPNDTPATSQKIAIESSVAGVIHAADLDHFRVEGPSGQTVTVDFEARRLGTSITPVLTILNVRGVSIAQARESRSADHDARLAVEIPKEGAFIVQVRDNTYGGDDSASYRIRVTTTPFATGLFPLGGPKGKPLQVVASGGSLKSPVSKSISLPDRPGASVDPGLFEVAGKKIDAPGMVLVGGDAEIVESNSTSGPTAIKPGETANGRIERRNEVDRYSIALHKGEKYRISVEAEPLGSWLDSVLSVKDGKGGALIENDDFVASQGRRNNRNVNQFGLEEGTTDSAIDWEVPADGTYTIEVTDRYGDGGPEYGYRLSVGVTRPDFAVNLLIGNPNANGQAVNRGNNRAIQPIPGQFGVFNLAPGSSTPVNFIVLPVGRPGAVTVRAVGLPDGVTVNPVKVEISGPVVKGEAAGTANATARADNLVFNVASYAYPGLSEITIVATAEPTPGTTITRTATAIVGLNLVNPNVPGRPITRKVDHFPIRVVGEYRPRFIGPPEAPKLTDVRIPGVLLAGDRIDLGLDFDVSPLADPGFTFDAKAKGIGLATNTVILSGSTVPDSEEDDPGDVIVRVLASAKAQPGVYPIAIRYSLSGGKPVTRDVLVIVRRPVEVLLSPEPIALKPGGSRVVRVGIRREPGANVEIELKAEGLPRGVKLRTPVTLNEAATDAEMTFVMAESAKPIETPSALRIVAVVRMPRGSVSVESQNRPMIVGETVDQKGRSRIE